MIVHGSAVAFAGRGLLILGPSGAGKSSLALAMMALGAGLVADDRTVLRREGEGLLADAPPALRGRIEARHLGILGAEAVGPVRLVLAVDLAGPRAARLPEADAVAFLGCLLPRIGAVAAPELAPALRQYLAGGRTA
ncbi:serine kinase [Paracoccus sp. S-4012]|nr:serine kinase [Paracoccus sp. S-4012]